jgi:cytochrome c biogenesis protein CcmG, thiol:disulfide interchange protein DsbE
VMLGILLISAIYIVWSAPSQAEQNSGLPTAPAAGFVAPDFELVGIDGKTYRLSSLQGKVILVNFWASWCPPCKAEMPAMESVFLKFKNQEFTILAVNATHQDALTAAYQFSQDQDLTFPILLDKDGSVNRLYEINSLPTSFFIDRDGMIQDVIIGGPMSEALLRIRVENLINKD